MIEIDGLTKRYGRHTVVDNLGFKCTAGEVLGFLGPNGAGKSTTMKMLTGFVAPSGGRASLCGHDIQDDTLAARRRLGYLPEGAPCYAEMTPATFLDFIGDIRELSGSKRKLRLDHVIETLHRRQCPEITIGFCRFHALELLNGRLHFVEIFAGVETQADSIVVTRALRQRVRRIVG